MDGLDCLGATDTGTSFSDFLKKAGTDVLSQASTALSKDGTKTPAKKDDKAKSSSSSSGSLAVPLVVTAGGVGAGALLWKAHRIWGGVLGGVGGGVVGKILGMFF